MTLEGKCVVVTGGSRGIGREIARLCCREGAIVGVNYNTSEREAQSLAEEAPERYRLLPFDVSDSDGVRAGAETFVREVGKLDGWVNCAGWVMPELLGLARKDSIERQIAVNLFGVIFGTQAALRPMIRQRGGSIVNISSVAAVRPSAGQSVYAAAKGGVEAFTRAVAVEYAGKEIRANVVRPGYAETEMIADMTEERRSIIVGETPMRRVAQPAEIAEAVVYLLSDRSTFVTGSVLTVDGGFSIG